MALVTRRTSGEQKSISQKAQHVEGATTVKGHKGFLVSKEQENAAKETASIKILKLFTLLKAVN